jgi:hypothetical protein
VNPVLRRFDSGVDLVLVIGIAEGTVKVHRGRVIEKLGARSVADLVRLCDAAGEPPATGQRVSNPAAVNSVP